MQLTTTAIVCTNLPHGEAHIIVRALSPGNGLIAFYVRGGRSRRLRPVLQPGNIIAATVHSRIESHLASGTAELIEPRAALVTTGLGLAILEWSTALTAAVLPEAAPHPALHGALDALTAALAAAAPPLTLGATLARYELLLLAELGFAPDLSHCVVTGTSDDLAFVSPRSSQAVSRSAGLPHAARLLPLPPFLITDAPADAAQVLDALALTGHFLGRDILGGAARRLFAARERLVARLPTAAAMDEPPAGR